MPLLSNASLPPLPYHDSALLVLMLSVVMLPLLQAFSLHSSVSSPGLLHHSSDPSGMATPQLLEHASSGASQLQHSVDAPHQVYPAISHNPLFVYSTISAAMHA